MKFDTKTIDEVTETLIDYRGKTPPKTTSGVKLITAKIIKDGFIVDDNFEYISEETYQTWMRRGLPKQGDILITTEAPLGQVAQLRTPEKVALAQRVILLRGHPQIIDQHYYFQALKSPFLQAGLQARATGTTVAGIKQSELRQVEIPYFPLPTQRKMGFFADPPEKVYSRDYLFFADRYFSPKEQYTLAFEGLVLPQPLEKDISGIMSSVPTGMNRSH